MPGYPWGQPSPPPRKRRTGLIVGSSIAGGLVIVVVILAVIGATMQPTKPVAAHSPKPSASTSTSAPAAPVTRTLTIPASVAGYTKITGPAADKFASDFRKQAAASAAKSGSAYADAYAKARIAFYNQDGSSVPSLIYIGFAKSDGPQLAALWDQASPSMALDVLFMGMNSGSTTDHPAGPMGGILRCGTASQSGTTLTICAWMDSSVLGMLLQPNGQQDQLASTTLAFRAAAEH